jgi:hypothetical protein
MLTLSGVQALQTKTGHVPLVNSSLDFWQKLAVASMELQG